MRACRPKAAPPVARAIVTSETMVRPVSIMFAPPDVDGGEDITTRFSFGFPLTADIPTAQYLNENPTSGAVPTPWSMLPFQGVGTDRKSTRLNSSHDQISYAVFCLKKKKKKNKQS